MKRVIPVLLLIMCCLLLNSCKQRKVIGDVSTNDIYKSKSIDSDSTINFISDYFPLFPDGDINVVIEIPTGTTEKWEIEKKNGTLELEYVDNKPRIIQYLGYPANYGMIPRTLLPKEAGGDGDPLDVIVLGAPVERGKVVKCKLIGVLYLVDRGEQDDKLIAVMDNSPLYVINSITELDEKYKGITNIIQIWFTNYKGPGKLISNGYGEKSMANEILNDAIKAYK